jgi:hypothetical protein
MPNIPESRTVREMISDVRQDLHSVNLDEWIPASYIYRKLVDTAGLFLKREADGMRTQLYPDIWVTVDDLEMEESELVGAYQINVPDCTRVMVSKKPLPRIFTTRFGYLANISSIDYSGDYIQSTPRDYNSKQGRRYKDPTQRYFWIYNGHLLIPKSFVKSVTLRAIFANKKQGLELNGCGDDICLSTLDYEFPVPGHLLSDVKKATVIEIASTREKIVPSEYPNLNELVKKSPTSK